jgi:hypothetical protein
MLLKALEEVAAAPNPMMAAEMAVIRLTHVADLPDPERLLGPRFTLSELQRVHEAVAGEEIDQFRFRRLMKDQVVGLEAFEEPAGGRGRPARVFRRRGDRD